MSNHKPLSINQFPLTEYSARQIINDLAEHHTGRIRWSRHVKERMVERGVTTGQILTLLKSKRSVFTEGPYQTVKGDWQFNLKGMAAGDVIELVVVLKKHHDDPAAILVTVWVV